MRAQEVEESFHNCRDAGLQVKAGSSRPHSKCPGATLDTDPRTAPDVQCGTLHGSLCLLCQECV